MLSSISGCGVRMNCRKGYGGERTGHGAYHSSQVDGSCACEDATVECRKERTLLIA